MGKHVNTAQLAEIVGCTTRTLTNWSKDGLPVEAKGKRGAQNVYDTEAVIRWLVDRRVAEMIGRGGESYDYQYERARLTHFQANAASLDTQVKSRNLWPVDVVVRALSRLAHNARSRVLGVPAKMISRTSMDDREAKILTDLLHEALDELARDRLPSDLRERVERYHAELEATGEPEP